jgi:hypothetical protein
MSKRKTITEAKVEEAVRRAWKRALDEIANEPKLIVEACPDKAVTDSKQLEEVLSWLFKRREVNNGD